MMPPIHSSTHPIPAYYSFINPKRMKGWVVLVGWPVADGLPTIATATIAICLPLVVTQASLCANHLLSCASPLLIFLHSSHLLLPSSFLPPRYLSSMSTILLCHPLILSHTSFSLKSSILFCPSQPPRSICLFQSLLFVRSLSCFHHTL